MEFLQIFRPVNFSGLLKFSAFNLNQLSRHNQQETIQQMKTFQHCNTIETTLPRSLQV